MLTRRSFVHTGIGAGCACAVPGLALAQLVEAGRPYDMPSGSVGCMVSPRDYSRDRLGELGAGQHMSSFTVGRDRYAVTSTSGNRHFDRALVEALAHMSRTFGVLPTFGFIKGGNVANAFATTRLYKAEQGDAPLPTRKHGTVLFGDGMLTLMREKGVQNPVAAVLAICAHEFGHIVQYNYEYQGKHLIEVLNGGQPTVKRAELHADYLAGYYIGTARRRNPETPAASVAQAAYVIGDFNVDARSHHGTPEERGKAVYAGYRAAWEDNLPFSAAAVQGLKFVGAA